MRIRKKFHDGSTREDEVSLEPALVRFNVGTKYVLVERAGGGCVWTPENEISEARRIVPSPTLTVTDVKRRKAKVRT